MNRRHHIAMMLEPELEEFAQSIIDERAPSITMSDARRVLRVLDTIFESNKGT